MPDSDLYHSAPRTYAIELVESEGADLKTLFFCCLKFMSAQDVRDMLDDNELSPRFLDNKENTDDED